MMKLLLRLLLLELLGVCSGDLALTPLPAAVVIVCRAAVRRGTHSAFAAN